MPNNAFPHGRPRWIAPVITALVLLVPLILLAIIKLGGPQLQREAFASLEITARLKAKLVESWLAERRNDGRVIALDAEMIEHITRLRHQADSSKNKLIQQRLTTMLKSYAYSAVMLLDPNGETLLAVGGEHEISAQTRQLLPSVFASGEIALSDFYLDTKDGLASLNFVVPLLRGKTGQRQAVAALVLHTQPDTSFFPMILAWPSASTSSETLLVQSDGESVVFLNQLRHAKGTALKLKRPLDDPMLPAAVAIHAGQSGTVRGKDYRNIDVLAAYQPVADTDWYLIAKVDYAEVMAPLWNLVLWVGLVAFVAVVVIGIMLRFLWTQQERLHQLAAQARQAATLRESEARFRAVTETARDAIITVDSDCIIVGWNSSASRMFGFDSTEIMGQHLTRIIPPRFHMHAMKVIGRMKEGNPERQDVESAEVFGRHKDDSEIFLERSVASWHTNAGWFLTFILRDIGERKKAEDALRIAAVAFESHEGIVVTDADEVILRVNRGFTKITGYSAEEAIGQRMHFLKSDHHGPSFYAAMWQQILDHETWQGEIWNRNKNGEAHPHWLTFSAVKNDRGAVTHYVGTYTDITERKKALAALEASENWFRSVFENANTGIAATDRGGRITSFNEAFRAMLGFDAETLRSMSFEGITHPDDLKLETVCVNEIFARQRSHYRITKRYVASDGHFVWVDISVAAILDAWGEVANFVAVVHDITERKQQEEQTRQLLAENETILSNAMVGIVYLKQRCIVSCNRRFEELFGYDPGELIGASSELLYDTHDTFLALGERAYTALGEAKNHSEEVMLRHKDGSLFWGALNGRAIDPSQPNDGSIWIYADISERRQAEQESSKLLQAVEQTPISIVITDKNGLIEYVNPSFTRVTGYTRDEAIGQNPRILKAPDTSPVTHEKLWRTILAGKIWRGILHNRCKNGDLIWEDTSVTPIFNSAGEITNFVAVKEDVTERKRIEQQLEEHQANLEELVLRRTAELSEALEAAKIADRSKDEFLANITHELRTPLSAVIGFSGLARPFCTDARQREYLDKVNTAGKTLSGIINDLLDLSKIVAGRMDFEANPFSLRHLIVRTRSVISYKAEEKGLELVERIDDEVPDILLGDSLRLEQILLNLLSNAVKFTDSGRIELRIGVHAIEPQRVCLKIDVEDTGIGLRQEEIALLFKPFSQADTSVTRKFGGTGLGLAICRRLAEMMDGDISVTSTEGKGATFRVRIWLALCEDALLPPVAKREQESGQVHYQNARVLVVDDQPFNRDVVEGLLAVIGITPYLAENGREAINMLTSSKEAFDLVLMDVQMPVMDGITATREIRNSARFAQLPIIAMTAHTMTHEREMSSAAGMNDHIGKPFDEVSFYRLLAKWIPQDKQHLQESATLHPVSANGFPALTGVDTTAGLSLLQGDEARYRHWLKAFIAEAPIAVVQIRESLGQDQPEPASMSAHALKGRTGLLGMKELHTIAAALEAAIDTAEPTEELLLDLERGVSAMCAEIRRGLDVTENERPVNAAVPETLPQELLPISLTHLIASLKAGDSDCDRYIADCLAELEDTVWAPRLRQALHHAKNFDYEAACRLFSNEPQGPARAN